MIENIVNINYIINGFASVFPTKMVYEQKNGDKLRNIYFEINFGERNIISKQCDMMEYAIAYLQNALPKNISIACCISCRYGNFCPYGGNDNEIFCLKDFMPKDKYDVCNIFSETFILIEARKRILLDFCDEFKPITDIDFSTYNDWKYKIEGISR